MTSWKNGLPAACDLSASLMSALEQVLVRHPPGVLELDLVLADEVRSITSKPLPA